MKNLLFVLSGLLILASQSGFAGELDPTTPSDAPKGLIVRSAPGGAQEVFAADISKVTNDADAAAAIQKFVTPEQQVKNIVPLNELDKTSSDGAWCSWYNPYYSNYGYYGYRYYFPYSYGFNYSYVPYYSYYYGSYYYYYYAY